MASHFGLIGRTLGHSFSKKYFETRFGELGLEAIYNNYELNGVEEIHSLLVREKLKGFNVTIPFKKEIIPLLHHLSEDAKGAGAVNCVTVTEGILTGHNTDVTGFESSFLKNPDRGGGLNALVLGDGGASGAVQYCLAKNKISFLVVSRHPAGGQIHYSEIDNVVMQDYRLLVNTTPLGMHPHTDTFPLIPYEFVSQQHIAFDLVYNPAETLFLEKCRKQGAETMNGLDMLYLQAEESLRIFLTCFLQA